jgi:hypothetical protein
LSDLDGVHAYSPLLWLTVAWTLCPRTLSRL